MKIYNTISREKEEFVPLTDPVKMYVCGITPYSDSHVGHAMSYIVFDVVRRYLEWKGYNVLHIQNFTDVDDKIINKSAMSGDSPKDLAERLIQEYFNEMDALNVKKAHRYPRATEEIPKILEMVEMLVEQKKAYQVDGDVYYRVNSYDQYGKLSRRNLEGMLSGVRVEIDERKEHPMDFALWKSSKPGEPYWKSKWGLGRPGWHMECSAMSLKYLGESFDIHGGGMDLVFPHHENEIAQTEAYTGVSPSVRYWMHHGLLELGEEKMSKSLGNLVTIKETLSVHSPDALRLFILSSHYRNPLKYSGTALKAMEKGAIRLRNAIDMQFQIDRQSGDKVSSEPYRLKFIEAMDDDFGTPQAIASLYDLAREINRGSNNGLNVEIACDTLRDLCGILGLALAQPNSIAPINKDAIASLALGIMSDLETINSHKLAGELKGAMDVQDASTDVYINSLISIRNALRKDREWRLADRIRTGLIEQGITIEDSSINSSWKRS